MTIIVIANIAFACLQYSILFGCAATLQLFAIYHGAPFCGCFGSDVSLPAWNEAEAI